MKLILSFWSSRFCYMTKKSRQKFKYLENRKSFWREMKSIFHHFYRAFSCQKLSQIWECAFKRRKSTWKRKSLEIVKVVLVQCNLVYNQYQQNSEVLYTFIPNKSYAYLSNVEASNLVFLKKTYYFINPTCL